MTHAHRHALIASLLSGTACAHTGAPRAVAPSDARESVALADSATAPCAATADADRVAGWRLVSAGKLAFCLPPKWRVSGSTASLGSATLRWGTGEPARGAPVAVSRVVVTQRSSGMGSKVNPDVSTSPQFDGERTAEIIGGQRAEVWRTHVGAQYFAGGKWAMPHVYITGEAGSSSDVDMELAIIRTARFPKP